MSVRWTPGQLVFAAGEALAFAGLVVAREMAEPGTLARLAAVPRGQAVLGVIAAGVTVNSLVYLSLCPLVNRAVPPERPRGSLRRILNVAAAWGPFVVCYLPAVLLLLVVVPRIVRD